MKPEQRPADSSYLTDSHVSLRDFNARPARVPAGRQLPAAFIVLIAPANVGVVGSMADG
jgi:hypothetical protein